MLLAFYMNFLGSIHHHMHLQVLEEICMGFGIFLIRVAQWKCAKGHLSHDIE